MFFVRLLKFFEKDSFEIFNSNKRFRELNSPKIYFENDVARCQRKCSDLIRCEN